MLSWALFLAFCPQRYPADFRTRECPIITWIMMQIMRGIKLVLWHAIAQWTLDAAVETDDRTWIVNKWLFLLVAHVQNLSNDLNTILKWLHILVRHFYRCGHFMPVRQQVQTLHTFSASISWACCHLYFCQHHKQCANLQIRTLLYFCNTLYIWWKLIYLSLLLSDCRTKLS